MIGRRPNRHSSRKFHCRRRRIGTAAAASSSFVTSLLRARGRFSRIWRIERGDGTTASFLENSSTRDSGCCETAARRILTDRAGIERTHVSVYTHVRCNVLFLLLARVELLYTSIPMIFLRRGFFSREEFSFRRSRRFHRRYPPN